MDLTVATYLLYLAITLPLTVAVARALQHHGEVFLVDVFDAESGMAHAVNQLLVVGFYLVNVGFLTMAMRADDAVTTGRELMEVLSRKVGLVAVVVGALHYGNVLLLSGFRNRAEPLPSPR